MLGTFLKNIENEKETRKFIFFGLAAKVLSNLVGNRPPELNIPLEIQAIVSLPLSA